MMQSLIRKPFLLTFTLFMALWGFFSTSTDTQIKISQIDQKIEELEDMKRGYEGKALRHEDYAQRLQFDNQAYLETRRHIQLAEENREKARLIQLEIDRLKREKKILLEKNANRR